LSQEIEDGLRNRKLQPATPVGVAATQPATVKRNPAPWKAWQKGQKQFDISSSLSAWVKEAGAAQGTSRKGSPVKAGGPTADDRGKASKKTEPNK